MKINLLVPPEIEPHLRRTFPPTVPYTALTRTWTPILVL